MQIDICAYTNDNFVEHSSSVLILTEANKKAIDKDDCNVENFEIVLFNGNVYLGGITLKSKEGCVVVYMENKYWHWAKRAYSIMYE